jgi:GNAT superfamily N-acetyltransferase
MTVSIEADLFRRGAATLVASWEEYARGACDAAVHRLPGASVAVFPTGPERTVYNNRMAVDDVRLPEPEIDLGPDGWGDYLHFLDAYGLPPGLLAGTHPHAFHVLTAIAADETVSAALAYDLDHDCGIYNLGTHEHARRRGLGTALTALHIHKARARGCRTATLQSAEMAERLYVRIGFRDLGRILEYAPPWTAQRPRAPGSTSTRATFD